MMILHLTIKKKWFDLIAAGIKTEEYREIKPYWSERFGYRYESDRESGYYNTEFTEFDIVRFRNGYAKNAPRVDVKCECISMGTGRPEWGAEPGNEYYVIELGDIISTANIPTT